MLPFLLAAVLLAAIAAVYDQKSGRIPNWLTLGGVVVALVGHFCYGWAAGTLKLALIHTALALGGALFCSLAPAIMFFKGSMGGGDLKLFAAIGAFCHPMLGIEAQLYAMIIAAVLAPARLAYEGKLFGVLKRSLGTLLNPFRAKGKRTAPPAEMMTWFRLGPAIFLGTLATVVANLFPLVIAH